MSNYVSLIAISGVLGVINYWFFRGMDLLDFFDHNESDEKVSLIIGLGLLNFVVNDILRHLTEDKWRLTVYIVASFVIAFVIEILLFLLLKWLGKLVTRHFFQNKKSIRSYSSVIKNLLEDDIGPDKKLYAYLYDFNNNIIEHGRIKYYTPNIKEENAMSFELAPESSTVETDFEKLRPSFPIDEAMDVYINFEHQYKLYIFIEANENFDEDITTLTNADDGILKVKQYLKSLDNIKEENYKIIQSLSSNNLRKIITNSNLIINQITNKDLEYLVAIVSAVYIPYILENIFNMSDLIGKELYLWKIIIYGLLILIITRIYFSRIETENNRNKKLMELIYYCEEILVEREEAS